MKNSKKKILISGMGVAGIICAILLDKEKYDVELIERADSFRNIGFSITLWKAGFKHLIALLETNDVHTTEGTDYFKANHFLLFGGNTLHKLKELDASGFAWAFERAHLMEMLQKVLFKHFSKESISFSTTIQEIKHTDQKATVTFNNGKQGEYDFIIVAEGINSTTRSLVPINERIIPTPFVLRYAWFSTETALKDNGALFITKGHLGVIHPPDFKNLFGFYFKKDLSEKVQREFEVSALSHIKKPNGEPTALNLETSHVFDLKKVTIDTYAYKNVIFVGDAAHGRPPTLGFGTTLAIEDAVLLCEKLNNLTGSDDRINKALKSYSYTRIERVESVYRFQDFIHKFITENKMKVFILSIILKSFLGKFIELRVKKLASN